ncbi:MAG: hypothetical protein ACYS80_22125 [Planctomycetota bacterium]|jgi:uncharacterized membrane protein (UPF0136 family)
MHLLKSLAGSVFSLANWIVGQLRTVQGREETSLQVRLIAAITLASIVMVVVFAVKLIRSHSRVSVTLATAGKGGEYYVFGEDLKRVVNNNQWRIRIETLPTLGSCENMQLLQDFSRIVSIVYFSQVALGAIRHHEWILMNSSP